MNKEKSDFKIAIVGDILAGGGAEKVHASLSVFFEDNGILVHNIIIFDAITYEYSGKLLNLGKMKNNTIFDKLKKIDALRKYLRENKVDYIIDFRYRVNNINELLMRYFAYNAPVIYTIRSGIIEFYISKNKIFRKLIYERAKAIITVSNRITESLQKEFKIPVVTIYNPLDLEKIEQKSKLFIPEEKKYIVAVGRMNCKIKQFDKLIEAYANSVLPQENIKLLILGEGKYLDELESLVRQKNLINKVIFKGHQQNPFPYQQNALFSVLSSKNEGFPNVLIESLATGTPVVSFDCFTGPNEIIIHKHNGILVEDQNIEKLTEAMNEMIENQELYRFCKLNAVDSVGKFALENIGKQWIDFLKYK